MEVHWIADNGKTTLVFRKTTTSGLHPEITVTGPDASIKEMYPALAELVRGWGKTETA